MLWLRQNILKHSESIAARSTFPVIQHSRTKFVMKLIVVVRVLSVVFMAFGAFLFMLYACGINAFEEWDGITQFSGLLIASGLVSLAISAKQC